MTTNDEQAQAAAASLNDNRVLRVSDLDAIVAGIVEAVQRSWRAAIDTQAARIDVLHHRLAEMEATLPSHEGTWDAQKTYRKNQSVAWDGSSWIARTDTRGQEPGKGATPWQLQAKRGRDARDR